jgi:phosphate-selective porin OprO and OprP
MRRLALFLVLFLILGCIGLAVGAPAAAQAPEEGQTEAQDEGQDDAEAAGDVEASEGERLDELDQRLRVLERRDEIADEQAAEKAKTAVSTTAAKDGFSFKSADNAFQIRFRGLIHFDARVFGDDVERPGVDTFLLRRVRPILEGTVFKIFEFRFTPDFGGGTTVIQDAYLDARFSPAVRVRAGKFKAPFGLERLQSASDLLFVERGLPTNLVPNRDLGLQLHGDVAGGRLNYAVGVFNGVPDGGSADSDANSDKELAARLFAQPFSKGESLAKGLGFGIAATVGDQQGTVTSPGLAGYRTGGQATFFSYRSDATPAGTAIAAGERTRFSPQLTWYAGRFGLLGEHVSSRHEVQRGTDAEELEHTAWQVAGSWAIFGGEPSFRGINPKRPFDLEAGTWGALEIAARYHVLDVDDATFPLFANPASAASKARAWAIGLNWYLNRGVRWMLDYEQTTFEGGAAAGDREDEKVLLNRIQIAF